MCCSVVRFLQLSEYVSMGKSLSFSYYVVHTKPRSHGSSGAFFICKKFPSLLYLLVFFLDIVILRSCDGKFVFHF